MENIIKFRNGTYSLSALPVGLGARILIHNVVWVQETQGLYISKTAPIGNKKEKGSFYVEKISESELVVANLELSHALISRYSLRKMKKLLMLGDLSLYYYLGELDVKKCLFQDLNKRECLLHKLKLTEDSLSDLVLSENLTYKKMSKLELLKLRSRTLKDGDIFMYAKITSYILKKD